MGKFKASGREELDDLIIGLCCFDLFEPQLSFILVAEIQNLTRCGFLHILHTYYNLLTSVSFKSTSIGMRKQWNALSSEWNSNITSHPSSTISMKSVSQPSLLLRSRTRSRSRDYCQMEITCCTPLASQLVLASCKAYINLRSFPHFIALDNFQDKF